MATQQVGEQFADLGELTLCHETFGERSDPALLLVMGLGTQMIAWREEFCAQLAARGLFVIRYDNRDVGRSTHFRHVKPPTTLELFTRKFKRLAYTLDDMADDGFKLLDHLGIERAHVVGASMGGMIAQTMAGTQPDRVLTLTSIMSTTGSRRVGQPALRVYPFFLGRPKGGREDYVERAVKLFGVVGSRGLGRTDEELRELAGQSYDRDPSSSGTQRQLAAIMAAGDRTEDLRRITAPTLVIHGTRDKLVNKSGGKATARAIDGARLRLIDRMGHDLPRGAWTQLIDAIAENTTRAEDS